MTNPIKDSVSGSVGIIELARPEKFNSLSMETLSRIDECRVAFEADKRVHAILVRAQGKHFCTGADLKEVKQVTQSEESLDSFIGLGQNTLLKLEASPLPVVIAVHGLCLAGGIELMLMGDICFASETAQFGDQHAQFGLIPGWGGSQRLTRIMGLRRAMDLFLSARWIKADEAHAVGLVNRVVPDDKLHEEALAYCEAMAARSRVGLAEMKRLARNGLELTLEQSMRLERDAAVRHLRGPDATEGLASFEERRDPKFKQ